MMVFTLVNHKNHGMYFDDNGELSDVQSDILPVKLTAALSAFLLHQLL